MKSKVRCPHSISLTCLAQEFGLVLCSTQSLNFRLKIYSKNCPFLNFCLFVSGTADWMCCGGFSGRGKVGRTTNMMIMIMILMIMIMMMIIIIMIMGRWREQQWFRSKLWRIGSPLCCGQVTLGLLSNNSLKYGRIFSHGHWLVLVLALMLNLVLVMFYAAR